ncbi:MAG: class I SAM-dependent methyltransferase [Reyranella sp.]|uniref:SAM-dependent methyltransferase n=1 Tax=Reyranella sp. TaxID=1929291 RepID=UPI0012069B6C|nr:cyclopropane-fatty-acyl-phospholipid synthase family protein [Reyranella sp.]TAJ37581.1 MAG: class I SAM-dependent methyltransferase [Reyranella sp.]
MSFAARFVLKSLARLTAGRLTVRLPDGTVCHFGPAGAERQAEIEIKDWGFFRRVLLDGDIGFAESYMDGLCDSPDLPGLLSLLTDNEKALGRVTRTNVFHNILLKLLHRRHDNSREGSKRNIHAHYDLGNEFYGLWLDPTMTYSSALYEGAEGQALEAAQTAKYERILNQLGARQGESILEIGCGWGGFAEAAARRGMRVTGVTISREQLAYAQARLQRAGLSDRVDLQFRDYRDIEGKYDHIVSIEMIEAVGERYWPDYFAALKRHSAPGGSAIVQAIVIADDLFEGYRRHPDFIQTYVFPGGMLLSPSSLREQCRHAGLKIAEFYSFGLDYARTLETWLGRFDRVADQVTKLGFDERFRRMWRYYLAYCAAGFKTRRTDVLQAHFRHI